ncbi:MAG: hypothetical protein ABI633_12135 [Burkholderiales bacterium]
MTGLGVLPKAVLPSGLTAAFAISADAVVAWLGFPPGVCGRRQEPMLQPLSRVAQSMVSRRVVAFDG